MSAVRALVTGATGQDGGYLVEQLVGQGVEVHALVRGAGGASSALRSTELPAGVHVHRGDLTDGLSMDRLVQELEPTEVYNLGGLSSVALSWEQPALTAQVSGVAVGHLLKASYDLQERTGVPVRFVQASSAEIFGRSERVPQDETTPVRPLSPYGAAKAYAHHLVGVYRARGLHASSCILYNHESPRRPQTFVTRKITVGAARIARGLQDQLAMGNLDARRDWGWAPDYVAAMTAAARDEAGRDYVVATGVSHSVRDFVAAAFAAAGITEWERHVTLDPRFARPSDAPELVGDSSRARQLLGWSPTTTFPEVVTRMVEHDLALLDAQGD
ncbi:MULTISPECIES: GDP-mannose 4,6-dehydratase [unclassified Modestobacter]|uniref:GDP-mannose 4,6-dehydratase n=1 Tax=unclassified Modestobacter TaxID=2643866 RepID=UPI0022AB2DCE|nr:MULTISPECIES: GDP-mannose 4,6-dehydratase [unclassified Modestobacter]MCZ2823782.1 GDP-mannose 4,6-dehydratase [Modestobacter sp. VKM Ac-2981]MCZ2852027.1 GDP-mannose 4,6-dehydratase [Modestobacter sp. VKM Ac-2982]